MADPGLNINSPRVSYCIFENDQLQLYKYAYLNNVFLKKRKAKAIKLTKWLPTLFRRMHKNDLGLFVRPLRVCQKKFAVVERLCQRFFCDEDSSGRKNDSDLFRSQCRGTTWTLHGIQV